MIRLHTLGALDLRGPDGRELRSVLQQPKRLALLAYLALATPRGFHRKDTLLALFWPELDQEHARHALRQAVHMMRRALGADVVVSRGEDELGLGEDVLWCDAVAFEQALDAGQLAQAVELYRGEFLGGFFVSEAGPAFEQWLERERARLRQRAAEAAWVLAEGAAGRRSSESAARWAHRAADLSLDDERAVRRLLSLL